jgi:hypothetical protein
VDPEEIVEQTPCDLREAASFVPVIRHEPERAPEPLLASTLERLRDPSERFLRCILRDAEPIAKERFDSGREQERAREAIAGN